MPLLSRKCKIKKVKNRYKIIYRKNPRPMLAVVAFTLLMACMAGHMVKEDVRNTEAEKLILQGARLKSQKSGQNGESNENSVTREEKMRYLLGEVLASQLGKPYMHNGEGPEGFDCSGLVKYAYGQIGIEIPRVAADQAETGIIVDDGMLNFGDVLFFGESPGEITHVGIYTGYGCMIHAPKPGDAVRLERIDNEYYKKAFVRAVRLI